LQYGTNEHMVWAKCKVTWRTCCDIRE
jgi:hypothetical protein